MIFFFTLLVLSCVSSSSLISDLFKAYKPGNLTAEQAADRLLNLYTDSDFRFKRSMVKPFGILAHNYIKKSGKDPRTCLYEVLALSITSECSALMSNPDNVDYGKVIKKISTLAKDTTFIKTEEFNYQLLPEAVSIMLSFLEIFEPTSKNTLYTLQQFAKFCTTENSKSALFSLLKENLKQGHTLPLILFDSNAKDTEKYDQFMQFVFDFWSSDKKSQVPTQFFIWNLLNGPDSIISTSILLNLSSDTGLGQYLASKPVETGIFYKKLMKYSRFDDFVSSYNGNETLLSEMKKLKEQEEKFKAMINANFLTANENELENILLQINENSKVLETFYSFDSKLVGNFVQILNYKIFEIIENFDNSGNKNKILLKIILTIFNIIPSKPFDEVDYEPVLDFFLEQQTAQNLSQELPISNLTSILVFPFVKLRKSFLIKLWQLMKHQNPQLWLLCTNSIYSKLKDPIALFERLKTFHELFEESQQDFIQISSIFTLPLLTKLDPITSKPIFDYFYEHKLLDKSTKLAIEKFISHLESNSFDHLIYKLVNLK